MNLETKDFLTGEELSSEELFATLSLASDLKKKRGSSKDQDRLKGKSLALLFDKPSLRTRMSFYIAMSELGGTVIESVSATRKHEEPQDLARVLSGYCHAIMIRTFDDLTIQTLAKNASIPVINGLSDHYHPCQTLADLLTIQEEFSTLKDIKIAYIGDGNNTLQSFMPIVEKSGIDLRFSCPKGYGPKEELFLKYSDSQITRYENPFEAVQGADVIYTDVWASMGFEEERTEREKAFQGFQVNREMIEAAGGHPKLMHCLPMVRGQEIAEDLPDSENSLIFKQSENRLHVQKALLIGLIN